jgi:hypothetical protein
MGNMIWNPGFDKQIDCLLSCEDIVAVTAAGSVNGGSAIEEESLQRRFRWKRQRKFAAQGRR